ncbi:tetratricopeptide repeat protein [Longimicrobium sp.]|uniref:tetratricopeptide repeat protein n=1 Tax=Longimicrobium sp. TaxID=2029185 RepID=UPI002E329151|nr:tetratricopeptide repeat protein [Longimicrobium sp.]HEX6039708.1 tetratricopeptide repeat protein [Longimicrobium sp.]
MSRVVLSLALLVLAAAPLRAQHEGHGAGAGPAATGLGEIDFPTSASPAAHPAFERGVLYLHNFHYPQAAEAFREAQRLDPGDVMSFWGEAMTYTHPVWNQQDTAQARAALRRLAPTSQARLALARTERERMYLQTVEALYGDGSKAARDTAFSQAMERLHARFPDDVEAASFYALSLLGLNQGQRETVAYARAADVSEPLFRAHPWHPGAAHYLIHAVDAPEHAVRGLDAARAYEAMAPQAAHAQHMTSHIYIAVGDWDNVVRTNVVAQSLPPEGAGPIRWAHYTQWLIYGLLQQGRNGEARVWLDSIDAQLARIPAGAPANAGARGFLVPPAAWYVVDGAEWNSPFARMRVDTARLGGSASPQEFAVGYAALRRGDLALADSMIARLAAREWQPENRNNYTFADRGYTRVMEGTLRALRLHAAGDADSAVALLRAAAELEASLPMAFGPPVTVKPPREVLGELLLELGRPAEAATELEQALARTPGRASVLLALARAHRAQGHRDAAMRRYAELATAWQHASADSPAVAEVRAGAEGRWER